MNNEMKSRVAMLPIPLMYTITLALSLYLMTNGFIDGTIALLIFFIVGACLSSPFFYLMHHYSQLMWGDIAKTTPCPHCNQNQLIYIIPTWTERGYNLCNNCKEKSFS